MNFNFIPCSHWPVASCDVQGDTATIMYGQRAWLGRCGQRATATATGPQALARAPERKGGPIGEPTVSLQFRRLAQPLPHGLFVGEIFGIFAV